MSGPKLNRDWIGLRVKLRRRATNQHGTLPIGTVGFIDGYSAGRQIRFEADSCKHCGFKPSISGMHRSDFAIMTPPDDWPDTQGRGRRR